MLLPGQSVDINVWNVRNRPVAAYWGWVHFP